MLFYCGRTGRNRARIQQIVSESPTALDALALMFTDPEIEDDGTLSGRVRAVLAATEHRFVPGLHTGLPIGMSGFAEAFQDPWEASKNQAGHFLTAVRMAFDSRFLSLPFLPLLLGALGDDDKAIRLIVGHEKVADPIEPNRVGLRHTPTVIRQFRRQYQSATVEDVANFRESRLKDIEVGAGLGNSMADLRLSYKGWLFGRELATGEYQHGRSAAEWIRRELGQPGAYQS